MKGGARIEKIFENVSMEKLYSCLDMDRRIVGVKFLFSEDEFDSFDIEPAKNKLSYCMMVKIASGGRGVKVRSEHFKCNSSARALGIKESDANVKSGRNYYSYGLYDSLCTARDVQRAVTYMEDSIYGMVLQPIEMFKADPDIAIIISNPYNVMRIVQGYTYTYGIAENIKFAGNQGICSDLTARPYENNDINVSLLRCLSSKLS